MDAAPRRILIVRLSHLGDVVHALGVFHALRAEHPGAEIGWAVQPEFADLLRGLAGLERIFEFDRRAGLKGWRALRAALAEWRPDWAVDAQGNLKSACATWISGAARRSGLHPGDWRERAGAWLMNDHAPRAQGLHAMQRMSALARHCAPGPSGASAPRCDPGLSEEELTLAAAELRARGLEPCAPLLVHLSTPGDVRSWPAQRFVELGRALEQAGERALFLSGPAEESLGRIVERELRGAAHIAHWSGQRGLRRLAALFTLAARSGATFVGCDSGPMHLAWACGLPVVCLSGPQDARRTGPWPLVTEGSPHRVVRALDQPACAPCLARRCRLPQGPLCMSRIAPAQVLAALSATSAG